MFAYLKLWRYLFLLFFEDLIALTIIYRPTCLKKIFFLVYCEIECEIKDQ